MKTRYTLSSRHTTGLRTPEHFYVWGVSPPDPTPDRRSKGCSGPTSLRGGQGLVGDSSGSVSAGQTFVVERKDKHSTLGRRR